MEKDSQVLNETLKEANGVFRRNTCLFFFEAIACCLIVFVHCSFPGDFGIVMSAASRFGVPLFFAVSGFFLYKEDAEKQEIRLKVRRRSLRVFLLLLFSSAIYLILGIISSCFGKESVGLAEYFESLFNWKELVLLLVCNDPLIYFVNWFMVALLLSYLVIYLFPDLFFKNRLSIYIVSSLAIFWTVFRIAVIVADVQLFGFSLSSDRLYRSWYFYGLPFICLGMVLKKNESFLTKIPTYLSLVILSLSFVAMITEQVLLVKLFSTPISYSFGSIGCVFSMIALSVKKPELFSKSKLLTMKGNWTTYVYIFHCAVIICVSFLFSKLGIEGLMIDWLKPIIVLAISLCVSIAFNWFIEFIKEKRKATVAK